MRFFIEQEVLMMNDMIEFLKNEGVSPDLVREVQE